MRVYVINLDRAPDRMAHMQDQFARLGVAFTRVAGVDARSMSQEQIAAFRNSLADVERHSNWSPGGIGCFLSHKKTWGQIASADDDYAAVFEDDAHLSARISNLLKASNWIPPAADIVRLETTLQGMKLEKNPVSEVDRMKLFKVCSGAWGAAGYVIRREIADWIARSPQRLAGQADWFLFHDESPVARAMNIFQLDPAPCVQDQYHPELKLRRNFEKVTEDPSDWGYAMKMAGRRALSPLARKVTGRRGIPLA